MCGMATTRHQRGYLYESGKAFHIRYVITELEAGTPVKRQRSEKLCDIDRDHPTKKSKSVLKLRDAVMARVNVNENLAPSDHETTVRGFYDTTYLPKQEKNLKPSSLHSLKQIWKQHLRDHFDNVKLSDYRTHDAYKFLTKLSASYGKNTIQHLRSAMSGVFQHATNLGIIQRNPLRELRLERMKSTTVTDHYTLEQLEDVISCLADRPDCQLIMMLAGFCGLRPGEINALRWEDFANDHVHVRRSMSRTEVSTPKTDASVRSIPLVAPVKFVIGLWRQQSGNPQEGWVFTGRFGATKPGDLKVWTRFIKQRCNEKGITYKTPYCGRRGAATMLTQLMGNPLASAQLLGHADTSITMEAYIKHDRTALISGMKKLNKKLKR